MEYNQIDRDKQENEMLISNMMLFNKLKKAAMVKNPATSTTTAPKKVVVRRAPITTNPTKPPSVIARLQPSSRLINNSTGTISTRAPHLLSSSSTTATAAITTGAATISTTDDSDFVAANQSSVEDDLSPQASPTLCSSRIDEQLTEQPSFHGVFLKCKLTLENFPRKFFCSTENFPESKRAFIPNIYLKKKTLPLQILIKPRFHSGKSQSKTFINQSNSFSVENFD